MNSSNTNILATTPDTHCKSCGAKLSSKARFCVVCGIPVEINMSFVERAIAPHVTFADVHRYEPTEEDQRFEKAFQSQFSESIDKHFYANVVGVTYPNEDGSSREDAIESCKFGQLIQFRREVNNKYDPNAVSVITEDGRGLGYLSRGVAADVTRQFDTTGAVWMAMVRRVTRRSAGNHAGLLLCMFRLTPEYLKNHQRV
jgi:hypothetical protein